MPSFNFRIDFMDLSPKVQAMASCINLASLGILGNSNNHNSLNSPKIKHTIVDIDDKNYPTNEIKLAKSRRTMSIHV